MAEADPFALCLRYLALRDRSEQALRAYLRRKGYGGAAIDAALERCRVAGYIDDERYAASRCEQLLRRGMACAAPMAHKLRGEGVDGAVAVAAVERCRARHSEAELLRRVVERRWAHVDFGNLDQRQRRRIVAYLQRRGYTLATILDYLHDIERQNPDHDDFQ